MSEAQFVSRCWGVDPDFAISFTDDERREVEAIAGADLAPRVFEELRALAFHAQLRRSLTTENAGIVGVRKKHARIAKAARQLLKELVEEPTEQEEEHPAKIPAVPPSLFGFGKTVVVDEVAGEVAIWDEEREKNEFEAFIASVERIESISADSSMHYGLNMSGHNASDRMKEYVVDGVIEIFCNLMARDIPPSGGNPNGPAARFLFSAANPILRPIERGLSSLDAARQQLARRRDVHKRG